MYNIGLIHETITNEVSSNLNNKGLFKDYVKLIKENSRDTNMILKIFNTKSQVSQR